VWCGAGAQRRAAPGLLCAREARLHAPNLPALNRPVTHPAAVTHLAPRGAPPPPARKKQRGPPLPARPPGLRAELGAPRTERRRRAQEVAELGDQLVLVTGYSHSDAAGILRGYGFRKVHSLAEFAAAHPQLVPGPHERYPPGAPGGPPAWARERVAAVMVIETPVDWHQDLQLIVDLVRRAPARARGASAHARAAPAGPAADAARPAGVRVCLRAGRPCSESVEGKHAAAQA